MTTDLSEVPFEQRLALAAAWDEGYRTCDRVWDETADLFTPDEDRTDDTNPYRVGMVLMQDAEGTRQEWVPDGANSDPVSFTDIPQRLPDPEDAAREFHEAYERLAPEFGYRTREESAVPWELVPEANKELMIATAGEVLARLSESVPKRKQEKP